MYESTYATDFHDNLMDTFEMKKSHPEAYDLTCRLDELITMSNNGEDVEDEIEVVEDKLYGLYSKTAQEVAEMTEKFMGAKIVDEVM